MKKLFFAIFLIIMSLTGFGCVKTQSLPLNSFYLETKMSSSGEVRQTLAFPTFSDNLQVNHSDKIERYEKELYDKIYNDVYCNFYLKYWLISINGNRDLVDKISFTKPYLEDGRIIFSIEFSDIDAWRGYNGSDIEETTEEESVGIEFVTTVESVSSFPYSQINSEGERVSEIYFNLVADVFKKYFPDEDCSKFDYCFEYRYVTPYERIRSNADNEISTNEGVVHSWVMSANEVNNGREIKIWANNINAGWWYLLALIVITILSIIVFLLYFFKKGRKVKKNRYSFDK